MSHTETATDIAIVGAGPAGLALAALLASSGYRLMLLERQPEEALAAPQDDGREIALTHKSVRLLKQIGAWSLLRDDEVAPLRAAHVTDGASPYCLAFPGSERGPLGFIVPNYAIRRALFECVSAQANVSLRVGVSVTGLDGRGSLRQLQLDNGDLVEAQLVVAADSRFSEVRRMAGIGADMRDFGRTAIVGRVRTERDHEGIARECFGYGSTLALLPLAEQTLSSAVVTVPSNRAEAISALSGEDFARHVLRESDAVLGGVRCEGARFSYPLVGVYARQFYSRRFALVGDAAVGMHPVTAHGFNLGLASADSLAAELLKLRGLADEKPLQRALGRFQFRHRLESLPIYEGTNKVVGLFTDERAPAKLIRKAVLRVSNLLPPIRKAITYQLTR